MKTLYIVACVLLGVSIVTEIVAKQRHGEAAQTIAKAVTSSPEVRAEANQDADALVRTGGRVSVVGLITAGVGVVLLVVSRLKGNRWTLVMPIILAVAYTMTWLLMV